MLLNLMGHLGRGNMMTIGSTTLLTFFMSGDKFTDTAHATPRFVLPKERTTGLMCIPEGRTVSYQCIVTDQSGIGTSTTWRGDVFNCPGSSPLITLPHSEFQSGVKNKCGNLTVMSVGVSGTEYTSRLTLTATTELNGRMINCTFAHDCGRI